MKPNRLSLSRGVAICFWSCALLGWLTDGASAQSAAPSTTNAWPTMTQLRQKWSQTSFSSLQGAADRGDTSAQHFLAYLYASGEQGVAVEPAKAIEWYKRAGEAGYLPAWNDLAILYELGKIVPQDFAVAVRYYRQAAEVGFPKAEYNLGRLYQLGRGIPQDQQEALRWYRKASDGGLGDAAFELYRYYHFDIGVPRGDTEARAYLRRAAELGNARGQDTLAYFNEYPGDWYQFNPPPATNDMATAIHWYQLAADQNYAPAQLHLGLCYLRGHGVVQDEALALELIQSSADKTNAYALPVLAELYARGIGEPRSDSERPIALLLRAIEKIQRDDKNQPIAPALCFRYAFGLGTDVDLVEASSSYCSLHPLSSRKYPVIGEIPLNGAVTMTHRFAATIKTFYSAVTGESQAMATVGDMYFSGRDTPLAPARAWAWYALAARNGSGAAPAKQIEAESRMTLAELEQRQQSLVALEKQLADLRSRINTPRAQ